MTRILIGAPIRQHPFVLKSHLQTLRWQSLPPNVKTDYLFVDDNDIPESSVLLADFSTLGAPPEPEPTYAKQEETTRWAESAFHRMAAMRQQLLDHALSEGYDHAFMVDSDLLLDPQTLRVLLSTSKPIVSAVYYTKWQPDSPPLPQVWLRHPYVLSGRGVEQHEFLKSLHDKQLTRVYGLGGCTLISREALERGARYAPLLKGLPEGGMWRGEDRSFCIRAERAHIEMWADPWPSLFHAYRPSDRERIPEVLALLREPRVNWAETGDWINATLKPLQEPHLTKHVHHLRGRLGAMQIIPALEEALYDLKRGESAVRNIHFPSWWPFPQYANSERTLSITLHDIIKAN